MARKRLAGPAPLKSGGPDVSNQLFFGDNLDVLRRHIADESVDLVYLDPPFNSNQDYNVLFREQDGTRAAAQVQAFKDSWQWDEVAFETYQKTVMGGGRLAETLLALHGILGHSDMMAYLSMMAPRLVELRRVMKPTASIYLHCDPTASHYLKILMDAVFGPAAFRSEVIWKRSSAHNSAKRFGPVHDTLLFYAKGPRYTWNPVYQPLPQETIDQWYNNVEPETGRRFNRADMTAPGVRTGPSGAAWRGVDPAAKGRHWAIPGFVKEVVAGKDTLAALDALDAAGRLHWPKREGGIPMLKRYLDESKGIPAQDVIADISPLNNVAAERLGYPTQKPEALLERLIAASSNEGDVVLDPFCGCGTAIAAAQKLNRRWIGVDVTYLAVGLIKSRLHDAYGPGIAKTYEVIGEPTTAHDAARLAEEHRYQFQWWALDLVNACPTAAEQKKGADHGIDGRFYFWEESAERGGRPKSVIISVKSGNVSVRDVRDLRGVIEREKAAVGVLITLHDPTAPMKVEAAGAGYYRSSWAEMKCRRLQILTIEELLAGDEIKLPPHRKTETYRRAPKVKRAPAKQPELFDADEG